MLNRQHMLNWSIKGYKLLIESGDVFAMLFLLFIRLNWGWQFCQTGQGKLLNHQQVTQFFSSLNLPLPGLTAWFVGGIECIGGILLILGLATRPVGIILAGNMLVAYLSVESDRQKLLNFFHDQDSFLSADPFFFLLTALLAFAFGAGKLSLDALIGRYFKLRDGKSS